MNKQKEREAKDHKQWIDGYEHNLNLLLESLKYELTDINKDKALQYNTSKTLLWINIVYVGISVKVLEYNPNELIFSLFILTTSLSFLLTLFGMMKGKYNTYASAGRPKMFANLPNDQWQKTNGLLTVIKAYRVAIKYNGINIIKRSKWIRKAKIVSLISFIILLILSTHSLYKNKGKDMATKPITPTKLTITPTPVKRANDSMSVKPVIPQATKDSN